MPAPDPFPWTASASEDPLPPPWSGTRRRGTRSPWAARSPGAPSAPADHALFVLGADDTIVSAQVGSAAHSFFQNLELRGRNLRALLLQLRPDWASHLPAALAGGDSPIHLPEATVGASGVVLALHRLPHGEVTFVTAVTELAPPEWLRESGMADFQPDPRTFAKLFVRLRTVESRLERYLNHLPGVVFHQRADLSFSFVSAGSTALLGLEPEALLRDSHALLRLIHPADERAYYHELDRNADSARSFSLIYRVAHPRTQACQYLLDVRSPIRSAGGLLLGYEGVWLDVTRQKIAEHGLTARAWKETLSTLMSRVLDEFGTVSTGILSLSELYHSTVPDTHPLHEGLMLIKDHAAQAQRLVRKIAELNRVAPGDRTYVSLAKVVRDQLELLRVILPRGTSVSGPDSDIDCPAYLDEATLRQTLVNLAMNAQDALPQGGEIRLTLRRLEPGDAPTAATLPPLPSPAVPTAELVFSDNGCGIQAEDQPRIFDPFFSTKDSARGSGLGLYHARLFAESHGGHIAVRSAPGRGTDLVLHLPLADLSLAGVAPPIPFAASTKPIHVLFFDPAAPEEPPLLDTLRQRGWNVRTVATAEHAHRVLREEGVRLDLLLVRHRSADPSPRLLLAEVRRDHPGLPLVLLTGGRHRAAAPAPLRSQVDLVLTPDLGDRDAADSMTKLLRLP